MFIVADLVSLKTSLWKTERGTATLAHLAKKYYRVSQKKLNPFSNQY